LINYKTIHGRDGQGAPRIKGTRDDPASNMKGEEDEKMKRRGRSGQSGRMGGRGGLISGSGRGQDVGQLKRNRSQERQIRNNTPNIRSRRTTQNMVSKSWASQTEESLHSRTTNGAFRNKTRPSKQRATPAKEREETDAFQPARNKKRGAPIKKKKDSKKPSRPCPPRLSETDTQILLSNIARRKPQSGGVYHLSPHSLQASRKHA